MKTETAPWRGIGRAASRLGGVLSALFRRKPDRGLGPSEEKYRELFQREADALVLIDLETHRIEEVNAAALALYGYAKEEFLRLRIEDLSAEPERTREYVERARAGRTPGLIESIRHRRKDGGVFPAEISTSLCDTAGRRKEIAIIRDLTERRRKDEQLRQSEEKYRGLFESESDALVVLDLETLEIEDVNPSAVKLYGYTKEEFLKLHVQDISAEPEATRKRLQRREAPAGLIRLLHRKKDGSLFPVEGTTTRFVSGRRRKGVAVIRDLTERNRKDEELREGERRFRGLFESNRDALMTMDCASLLFTSGNPAAVAMFRAKDEADFVTHTPLDFSPEFQPDGSESAGHVREMTASVLREGSRHFEWTHKRLNGEEFPADVLLSRIDFGGKTYILATIRDLTDARRSTDERRLLAAAIEQTSECIVITDASARILYVNPAFERVTGYSREEALGKKSSLLKSGRHERSFYEEMWATLARGEIWYGRLFNRRKDGSLYEEETSIAPVRGPGGTVTHYIAVKRDVSKERALEAQFLHSQRMEAIGRLAGGVAHDFNNILTAIIGSAQLLVPAVSADRQASEDVVTIIDSGRRAAALTRQLLTFSRRQMVENTTFDLNLAVGGIQGMLRRTLSAKVRLSVEVLESPLWILADAGQIDQVLLNLAVNARDAMPGGGLLAISTALTDLTAARVSAHDSAPAGMYAALRVVDTGSGMTDSVMAHLFEPFFTTKEKGKGTGLGLSTVYGIVKKSDGFLFVDSAPGRGTSFDILFPLAAPPAAAGAGAQAGVPVSCRETILVVEDEEAVLGMVQRTLKSQGYTVLPSRNPAEALQVLDVHRGRVDLLLTDVVMPGMTGTELARFVTARDPGTKVLFMSGYPDGRLDDGEALSSGRDLLQKPFQLADLCARVRAALDASAAASSAF